MAPTNPVGQAHSLSPSHACAHIRTHTTLAGRKTPRTIKCSLLDAERVLSGNMMLNCVVGSLCLKNITSRSENFNFIFSFLILVKYCLDLLLITHTHVIITPVIFKHEVSDLEATMKR